VVLIEDDVDIEVNFGNVDAEGVDLAVGILDLGLGRSGRRRLVGLFLFADDDGAVVDVGTAGVRRLCRRRR
jgi:hypothetical protein